MIILVDMDGPLADFEQEFLNRYREQFPDKPYVPLDKRVNFEVYEDYPAEIKESLVAIYCAPDFFVSLPPVPGGIEALQTMHEKGHSVYICTAPVTRTDTCIQEKVDWVSKHLGKDWLKRIIITKDKTLVRGDYLIDDKPVIKGLLAPTWEQVVYSLPYNAHIQGKKRIIWNEDWQQVLGI